LTDGISNVPFVVTFLFPVSAIGNFPFASCKIKAFKRQHSCDTGNVWTLCQAEQPSERIYLLWHITGARHLH